ncbi:hypothetical protein ACJMK2_029621 [Sinanodonta woodiana]|uniref:Uncharacterized protein n=1 Tax=Sinanodonta woodiana TaxID=1069815 RepID=A0ABD3XBA4_SINWO
MSVQTNFLPTEMEVNPRLQNAIVTHHIIQVVSPVVVIIIYAAPSTIFPWVLMTLISAVVPIFLFIIFWIASQCNYKDLSAILVHFNPLLSAMWFFVYFPFCILCSLFLEEKVTILAAVITGFLSLSSAIFATYGIWKSARNVALRARSAKIEDNDALVCVPPPYEEPVTFTDLNCVQLPEANYKQPLQTM